MVSQQETQLSQTDRTTLMLVSSCCVLWGTEVRKVSISNSDLQGHSRALAMAPFD